MVKSRISLFASRVSFQTYEVSLHHLWVKNFADKQITVSLQYSQNPAQVSQEELMRMTSVIPEQFVRLQKCIHLAAASCRHQIMPEDFATMV